FVPGVEPGARYKYELVSAKGALILKSDPMAFATDVPPGTASLVCGPSEHRWQDAEWLAARASADLLSRPMSVYELHLGSWRMVASGGSAWRPLTYLELADQLPDYLDDLGFTDVEFLPVAEHPFGGSWGYQVSGYFAPTARHGHPDEFKALVDEMHQRGIGVIFDWVPAHSLTDAHALARVDGSSFYEHDDP